MGKVHLSWVIHNHQPEGNFTWVMDEANEKSYKPFLNFLKDSGLKVGLHNSGTLWEYFQEHDKDYIEDVQKLVEKGQIELIGGTYCEAILSVIPDADKVGQLKLLKSFLEKTYQSPVSGAWVAERVWEPNFPKFYNEAGYEYVFLDDYHFSQAGEKGPFHGYYLTDDQGYQLFVFPIDMQLRYLIPWREPEEIVEYLKSFAREDKDVYILYADDGEKFGLWQGTNELCYKEKYLEKLLDALKKADIEVNLPMEVVENNAQTGIVYLPTSTYPEMSEWSLGKQSYDEFISVKEKLSESERIWLHAGYWRRFLKDHPHNRWMYGRVVNLSRYLNSLTPRHPRKNKALMELYRAEANDVFWHGVFGGLYLGHLRRNLFHRLVSARVSADGLKKQYMEIEDVNIDGREELIVANEGYHAYLRLDRGSVLEFDLLQAEENMVDVLDEEPVSHGLFDDFWNGQPVPYQLIKRKAGPMELTFGNDSSMVQKTYSFFANDLIVKYELKKPGQFVVEIPLNLWNSKESIYVDDVPFPMDSVMDFEHVRQLHWSVGKDDIHLTCGKVAMMSMRPLLITHRSDLFQEITYQGTIMALQFDIDKAMNLSFELSLGKGGKT